MAQSHRVTVGVVGLGFGQHVLIPAFQAEERCRVLAVCARRQERAQAVAERLGVPKAYADWRRLVGDPEINAVALAIPPRWQPEIAHAVVAQRKHLFCEKPVALTREAAARLWAEATEAGIAHMVDFEFPEIEAWRRAKTLMDEGRLGRLRHAVVSWHVETAAHRSGARSWKTSPEDGGGALNLFCSHTLYYLEWLLGRIERVSVRLFPSGNDDGLAGDRLVVGCLLLSDGTPVSVSVSNGAFLGTGHRLEVYGEAGSLVLENPTRDYAGGFQLRWGDRAHQALEPIAVQATNEEAAADDGRIAPVKRLVERFATWICEGVPAAPTLAEGYRVQCLLDAARRSHTTGGWVMTGDEAVAGARGSVQGS